MLNDRWTRVLAMALVLPLAGACAETGDDEIDETETLETTPTTEMNRVELEPFGTSDVEGWVTARTEGEEVVLTLNLDQSRTSPQAPGDVGAEGEAGTEREMAAERAAETPSARLIEGMCMDVQPENQRPAPPTSEEAEQPESERESAEVETVAEFEPSDAQRGLDAEAGADARTTPSSGQTLEARVQHSEVTGFSYAVVVGEEGSDAVACADVTQLVTNAGSPAAGSRGAPGTGTDEIEDESGTNY